MFHTFYFRNQLDLQNHEEMVSMVKNKWDKGEPGPRNGDLVFNRRGRATCPIINDRELLYKGKTARSFRDQSGGGDNYICLTDQPEFFSYIPGISNHQLYFSLNQAHCYIWQNCAYPCIP